LTDYRAFRETIQEINDGNACDEQAEPTPNRLRSAMREQAVDFSGFARGPIPRERPGVPAHPRRDDEFEAAWQQLCRSTGLASRILVWNTLIRVRSRLLVSSTFGSALTRRLQPT